MAGVHFSPDPLERLPAVPSPPRRVTVLAVALLDVAALLVTVVATAVLALNDDTNRRWWIAVGLAYLLAVPTTLFLIRIADQRRSFVASSLRLADELEDRARRDYPSAEFVTMVRARRDAAIESGDFDVADRLTAVLAGFS